MPRFFIDTTDDDLFVKDAEGAEYPDLDAAKAAAVAALPDMAREKLPDGDARNFLALVRGADGQNLLQASLLLHVTSLVPKAER
ncbi:MAG: hypothetical protein EOP94_01240 [Zymomonas sp.]|nr:MAG: hypothetical protein EOP94_01240 [Zymomonas sp.]